MCTRAATSVSWTSNNILAILGYSFCLVGGDSQVVLLFVVHGPVIPISQEQQQ